MTSENKITCDPAITDMRKVRSVFSESLNDIAKHMVDYRATITDQAVRIKNLESQVLALQAEVGVPFSKRAKEVYIEPLIKSGTIKAPAGFRALSDFMDDAEKIDSFSLYTQMLELKEIGRQRAKKIDELEADRAISGDSVLNTFSTKLKDEYKYGPSAAKRAMNVTRLCNAAIHHLTDAPWGDMSPQHTMRCITTAIYLLKPLAGGQHDTYPHEPEDTVKNRSNNDWKDVPYAGQTE